jgi:acetyl esterase/lipase
MAADPTKPAFRNAVFKAVAVFATACALAVDGIAGPKIPINLWPAGAPGQVKPNHPEADITKPSDGLVSGRPVIRLGNVSNPTITVYPATGPSSTETAIIVCPGGAYSILAMDLEGTEVCEWLNSIGITGVLLKYRVPKQEGVLQHAAPLQDAQRAMGLVRTHATEWGINPHRIGILGFSAGGHLSAALSNNFKERTYPGVDEADKTSCRPDFVVLIYPWKLTVKDEGDRLSPEMKVSSETPPTFITITEDDSERMENALFYALALKREKVPVELHLYPTGGHGYGLRPSPNGVAAWPKRAAEWMGINGFLDHR